MEGFAGDMMGGDGSVMARMQKKFWKTKQVFIKATGKKEDEYVVASDADLDAKLEFFRSIQCTCTELLKVIERYQHRITRLSQEENELGLFLRFQAEHDSTKAGKMMDATSKALCASAKQRMAICPSLQRLHQEVDTFRRRAIADTLLTVTRMEKSRTEYRGALLWMKDISQELDPDTFKQLEKFRKVQAQVRGSKSQFEKLKNDVCQKVDMLGASRCNMLSHSMCTYQTTLLHFWEKTALSMSEIHKAFQGHVPYQFTTLKDLRDPLEELADFEKELKEKRKAPPSNIDSLVSLDDDKPFGAAPDEDASRSNDGETNDIVRLTDAAPAPVASSRPGDDLLLMAGDPAEPQLQPQQPLLLSQGGDLSDLLGSGSFQSQPVIGGGLLSHPGETGLRPEDEDSERGDMAFLKDLLSPGPGACDEFSREWQDAFGVFEPPPVPPPAAAAAVPGPISGGQAPCPPSPAGFLPSQLLDHSLSASGWSTPPMFKAPPLQSPPGSNQTPQAAPSSASEAAPGGSKDMSAWFNLFADLDPLSNPDAIGRSADELLNA